MQTAKAIVSINKDADAPIFDIADADLRIGKPTPQWIVELERPRRIFSKSRNLTETLYGRITPGEILLEEFLKPMGISQYRLAKTIGAPPRRINEVVLWQRGSLPLPAFGLPAPSD